MITVKNNVAMSDIEGMKVRRISQPDTVCGALGVCKGETAEDFEEVAPEDVPLFTAAERKAKIVELIRERYDQDDENGILRQRDTKPEEFAEFNAYVEECKVRAVAELTARAANFPEDESEH